MPARFRWSPLRRPAAPPTPGQPPEGRPELRAADSLPPVPNPAAMRRERRGLLRRRETGIRDLGGLTLEMVRRDRFRPELIVARAEELVAVERRINELDSLLASAQAAGRALPTAGLCKCGAPLAPGIHFCSHCGRPAATSLPVVSCEHCGQPLPAEANFCTACGNAVAARELADEEVDATVVRPSAGDSDGHEAEQ